MFFCLVIFPAVPEERFSLSREPAWVLEHDAIMSVSPRVIKWLKQWLNEVSFKIRLEKFGRSFIILGDFKGLTGSYPVEINHSSLEQF